MLKLYKMFKFFKKKQNLKNFKPRLGRVWEEIQKGIKRSGTNWEKFEELFRNAVLIKISDVNCFLSKTEEENDEINKAIYDCDYNKLENFMKNGKITHYGLQLRAADCGSIPVLSYLRTSLPDITVLSAMTLQIACYNNNIQLLEFLHSWRTNSFYLLFTCCALKNESFLKKILQLNDNIYQDQEYKNIQIWCEFSSCYLANNAESLHLAMSNGCLWHYETVLFAHYQDNHEKIHDYAKKNNFYIHNVNPRIHVLTDEIKSMHQIFCPPVPEKYKYAPAPLIVARNQ